MKTASSQFQTHIAGEVTTLCTCWRAVLENGTVYGFTNHDEDITFNGVTYSAASGFTPSDVETNGNLAVPGLDIIGLLSNDAITEADLMAGLWDHAEVFVFMVNWEDLTQGSMYLTRGRLGEVKIHRSRFIAEMRGIAQAYATQIGELYSVTCRANVGDARCGVNLAAYTESLTVTSVTSNWAFGATGTTQADGYFDYAKLTWLTGANAGLEMEVKKWDFDTKTFSLFLPMPYDIAVGDTASVHAGCDKILATCRDRFSNVVNFRGEPHVPGNAKLLTVGGQT